MEQSYTDIQTVIRLANRQRSDAMGEQLLAGWKYCERLLCAVLSRRAPSNARFAKTPASIG